MALIHTSPRWSLLALLVASAVVATIWGCDGSSSHESDHAPEPSTKRKKRKSTPSPRASADASDGGSLEVGDVAALLVEGKRIAEKTWPGSRLTGIRIGEEVPRGKRHGMPAVRVGVEFDVDPTDPTAKSGSVLCMPRCEVVRRKVDGIVYDWPKCTWDQALVVARKEGFVSGFPSAVYGSWAGASSWVFKKKDEAESSLELDAATCAIKGGP